MTISAAEVKVLKPIFLLADSQLLFGKSDNQFFLDTVKGYLNEGKRPENIKAAYIGASNGDAPAFYDIFKLAMAQVGITNCRMVPSSPSTSDIDFLYLADLILLAGGDVKTGWEVFQKNDFVKIITDKYHNGAILIGVSAGAVQLGLKGGAVGDPIETFKIVPYVISAHDENSEWRDLKSAVSEGKDHCKGFGIPYGGGAIFYPDWSIEAVRNSLTEIEVIKGEEKESLILPPSKLI